MFKNDEELLEEFENSANYWYRESVENEMIHKMFLEYTEFLADEFCKS